MATPYTYNVSPQAATTVPKNSKTYNKAYGGIPGQIELPAPYKDLQNLYPNLSGTNTAIAQNIAGQLAGELSPEAISAINDEAARFGVISGMPGSGLARNKGLRSIGLSTLDVQNQGIQNYNQTIPVMQGTQTVNPQLQAEIAARNATMNAAPVPQNAAEQMAKMYKSGMNVGGGGGGTTVRTAMPNFGGSWASKASSLPNNSGFLGSLTGFQDYSGDFFGTRQDPSPSYWSPPDYGGKYGWTTDWVPETTPLQSQEDFDQWAYDMGWEDPITDDWMNNVESWLDATGG